MNTDEDDESEWASDNESIDFEDDNETHSQSEILRAQEAEQSYRGVATDYKILTPDEARRRRDSLVNHLATVLHNDSERAELLLRAHKWAVHAAEDAWFRDERQARKDSGIVPSELEEGRMPKPSQNVCGVCMDECAPESMASIGCGHVYCKECWRSWIQEGLQNGMQALGLRCPHVGASEQCQAIVPRWLVAKMMDEQSLQKYDEFRVRSFIESKAEVKWCPGTDCGRAAEVMDGEAHARDVACECGSHYCFNCKEEAHTPVDCHTVSEWIKKNTAESENVNWILVNTKECPKCKRPIEKNQGCMHMTCWAPCRHEFCWQCKGEWKTHGERTGGFYSCNMYSSEVGGDQAKSESRRIRAKEALERYTHYFERWVNHDRSHRKALEDVRSMTDDKLQRLSPDKDMPTSQLKFVTEALRQVAECRRVLKWTYAFGYFYSLEGEKWKGFFEFAQTDAEGRLEALSEMAELQVNKHLSSGTSPQPFDSFRSELASLTAVTRKYFDTLKKEIENGLPSVAIEASQMALKRTASDSGI